MRILTNIAAAALMISGLALVSLPVDAQVYYTINGQPVTVQMQQYLATNGQISNGYFNVDKIPKARTGTTIYSDAFYQQSDRDRALGLSAAAGDRIVVGGVDRVTDGIRVRPRGEP